MTAATGIRATLKMARPTATAPATTRAVRVGSGRGAITPIAAALYHIKRLAVTLAVLLLPVQAWATTFYVSTSGSDANSCATAQSTTQSNQKLTIPSAIACLSAGDTLIIHAGTYTDPIDSETFPGTFPSGTDFSTGAITIKAATGETVTIAPVSGNSQAIRLTTNSPHYLIFQDLILDGINNTVPATGADLVYLATGAHHNRFERLEVKRNSTSGYQFSFNGGSADSNEILGGSIHDNGRLAYGNSGYGLYLKTNSNLVHGVDIYANNGYGIHINPGSASEGNSNSILGNKIHDNLNHGDPSTGGSTSYGIECGGDSNLIANNLFFGNQGGLILYGGGSSQCRNTKVSNNTFYGNLGHSGGGEAAIDLQYYGTGNVLKNNIIYANGTNAIRDYGQGETVLGTYTGDHSGAFTADHNIYTDPGFVSTSTKDFRLVAASGAAYNTGADLSAAGVTDDYDGVARPQSSAYDIGAFEYTASLGSPTITTTMLSDGQRSAAYSADIAVTGGTGTYSSCSITAGALPTSWTCTIVSNQGRISGPSTAAAGDYSFTVQITDSGAATDTQAYTVTLLEIDPDCSTPSVSGSWTRRWCPGASSSNGTADAVTTGVTTTASDDFAVCAVTFDYSVGGVTLSDSKSNTWTLRASKQNTFGEVRIYSARLTSVGASHTFTAATGGMMSFPALQCATFSGSHASPFSTASSGLAVTSAVAVSVGTLSSPYTNVLTITALDMEHANVTGMNGYEVFQRSFSSGKSFGVALGWTTSAAVVSTSPEFMWDTSMDAAAIGAAFLASNSSVPASSSRMFTRIRAH